MNFEEFRHKSRPLTIQAALITVLDIEEAQITFHCGRRHWLFKGVQYRVASDEPPVGMWLVNSGAGPKLRSYERLCERYYLKQDPVSTIEAVGLGGMATACDAICLASAFPFFDSSGI
jgi:hypothetical protein